jgi:ABC-2 type transport system permease protein/oleandomycin transport system permease protein
MLLFGYAFSWVFAFLGMLVSTPESANALGFMLVFPLTFISSAFVPVDTMPDVLKWFAEVNPFTVVVDEMRELWLGHPGGSLWQSVAWSLIITAVFAPLAVWRYRATAER